MTKHSKERAKERYNLELTNNDEQNIIELIKQNKGIYLGQSTNDKHMHFAYVHYKHIPIKVLYLKTKSGVKQIITIYPFDVDEYNAMVEQQKKQKEETFEQDIQFAINFLKTNGYIVYKKINKQTK